MLDDCSFPSPRIERDRVDKRAAGRVQQGDRRTEIRIIRDEAGDNSLQRGDKQHDETDARSLTEEYKACNRRVERREF